MPYSWCRVMLRHSLYITPKPAKPNCLSFACFSFSVWVVDWDFCLKGLDACQVCKKTIQTSKYYMVVAPNMNHFPKAALARLCYFAVWPRFIAGSTFLCYFLAFSPMHLPSFIFHYFTFAYSKPHDTDCHLQQNYFTENPFRFSAELLCTILSLLCHCLPEV